MSVKTILVVDDDPHIRDVLCYTLEKEGWGVIEAENGREGLGKAREHQPDVIVLDIMMPEMTGLELCMELRKSSQTPIVFLSSRDEELDRILGLEIGGDDYMIKPFSPRELVARLKVIFRRHQHNLLTENSSRLYCGDLVLDPVSFQVTWKQQPMTLTATEFNLLETFLSQPERVFTRNALIEADLFKDIISDRTIDSHIRRLRQKFAVGGCQTLIETVHGFGYKLGKC